MSTTPCKVAIDAEIYAKVKKKAKGEKRTIKSLVEEAFTDYLRGVKVEVPASAAVPAAPDPVLAMFDEQEAEARRDQRLAEDAADPNRAKNARDFLAKIQRLRQAHAAAAQVKGAA